MAQPVRIGIAGALGRMGLAIGAALDGRADAVVSAVFDKPGSEGQAWGALTLGGPDDAAHCDVIVDFTTPAASVALAEAAAARGAPALVIGSTGWGEAEDLRIWSAAKRIAIVKSGNYSLGVNVLAGLVRRAAERLAAADWDVEVFEAHHRRKVDAPSGTALMLGEAAARGRQSELAAVQVRARDGITGPRPEGAIGFSVLRGGGIVGEHSVTFAAEDELVTLSHSARDRSLFARGAVAAALWVVGKPPGLYDMQDVLGFRD
ncbi:MAG TPA: 4-hydroxy-tetrahydrodipicolinate reductase [Caulobacteraceae bacterium]|jgi:4-hydroxy-tetrahydrodipicolinate reductase|nr:4-hydroxy-tetrahydrodipicolinate reductase [Caulobacteraceae bacterium]